MIGTQMRSCRPAFTLRLILSPTDNSVTMNCTVIQYRQRVEV